MKNFILIFILLLVGETFAQNLIPSKEVQIAIALQAAPENKRSEATVYGYDEEGKLIVLKKGTNEFICITNNPNGITFSAACYHKDLEPFMARGRVLKAEGKNSKEVYDIREAEAKAGRLKMPDHPTTLYILYGKDARYDISQGKVINAFYRWVVYIPWATPESTGLPTSPMVEGGPWIMNPGSHKAHIMITPPWPVK